MVRTGIGFDAHPLVSGRKLFLGGVEFESARGLAGHSDADVVCHALADALLGAAGMGDIGMLFPDTDPAYMNITGLKILSEIRGRVKAEILNVDVTVIAEQPKIAARVPEMKTRIADALRTTVACISIKGKTTEMLGFTGRQEGIAAIAVATIETV